MSEGSEEDDELTIPASDSSDDSDSEGDLDEAASLASSVAELSSGTLACIPYFSMLSTRLIMYLFLFLFLLVLFLFRSSPPPLLLLFLFLLLPVSSSFFSSIFPLSPPLLFLVFLLLPPPPPPEINLKQQLVDQLEKAQRNLYTMKQQYEEKMQLLQHQIRSVESERDKVLKEISKC